LKKINVSSLRGRPLIDPFPIPATVLDRKLRWLWFVQILTLVSVVVLLKNNSRQTG
jgi:hypothetical protein